MLAAAELICPACSTPLRLHPRTEEFTAACPDCGTLLLFLPDEDRGQMRVTEAKAKPQILPRPKLNLSLPAMPRPHWQVWKTKSQELARHRLAGLTSRMTSLADPLILAWCVAGMAAVVLVVAVWQSETQQRVITTEKSGSQSRRSAAAERRAASGKQVADSVAAVATDAEDVTSLPEEPPAAAPPTPDRPPVEAARPGAELLAIGEAATLLSQRLRQRLVRFEQAAPVPFERLRQQFEAMLGQPVSYGESIEELPRYQQREVLLDLTDTTVAEALSAAARQAGLLPEITSGGVRLLPDPASSVEQNQFPPD